MVLPSFDTIIQSRGFPWCPEDIQPDGKLHRFKRSPDDTDDLAFYVAYQIHSPSTGKPFYSLYFGDLEKVCEGEPPFDWCSLSPREMRFDEKSALNTNKKGALRLIKGASNEAPPVAEQTPEGWFIRPLGFKEKEYFFTSSHNQQIVGISKFSRADFFNLMPEMYWELKYPKQNGGCDYDAATSELMDAARKIGIFQSRKIRGAGVWNDAGRVVVNMGDRLVVDGADVALADISSENFYTLGVKLNPLHPEPLTVKECEVITAAATTFKWKRRDFGYLLAGAMVTTRIAGALPVRPHVWLIGAKEAGKSTLFTRFIEPLIGNPRIFAAGNTTEAGIRQEVSANAVPVLIDEFENKGGNSIEIIQSVLDLMRIAWSETNAVVLKGSATGAAQSYQARFAAIVTSIRQIAMTDADQSRFATIELAPHGNDTKHWLFLQSFLDQINEEFGNRLFARTISMVPVILQNFKTMKKALAKKIPGQRFGDQYGMLLAGYAILIYDEALTEEQAERLAGELNLEEEHEQSKYSDQDACLDQLLTKKLNLQREDKRLDCAFSQAILNAAIGDELTATSLQSYGIRVDAGTLYIRTKNAELESLVYRGTRWSNAWGKSLDRLPGASRKVYRVGGTPGECVSIPLNSLNLGR